MFAFIVGRTVDFIVDTAAIFTVGITVGLTVDIIVAFYRWAFTVNGCVLRVCACVYAYVFVAAPTNSLVESYMYRRLTFIFELASNFISAHEDVDILELLNEGPVAYQLAYEKNRQLQQARDTLAQQLPVFPELARSLKTRVSEGRVGSRVG